MLYCWHGPGGYPHTSTRGPCTTGGEGSYWKMVGGDHSWWVRWEDMAWYDYNSIVGCDVNLWSQVASAFFATWECFADFVWLGPLPFAFQARGPHVVQQVYEIEKSPPPSGLELTQASRSKSILLWVILQSIFFWVILGSIFFWVILGAIISAGLDIQVVVKVYWALDVTLSLLAGGCQ